MRIRRSYFSRVTIPGLVLGSSLVLASTSAADPAGKPDIPSARIARAPQTIDQEIKLAGDYMVGRGVVQDVKEAAYWYEKAAGAGDPDAQLETGYLYEAGVGVPRDPIRAVHWYQLAASGGLVRAKVNLGIAYLWGMGVAKNEELSAELLGEAAKEGSGLAACYLGEMYDTGTGFPKNKSAAERWYAKGAKLHDPQAEYQMGLLFFVGENHRHDLNRAATMLRSSANAGFVSAMHVLGVLLIRNPALAESPAEASTLLNRAADAGIWKSSLVLGMMARDGRGIPADERAAYFHFRVGALQGGDEAERLAESDLRILSSKLGESQTRAIDAAAEEWSQRHRVVLAFIYNEHVNKTRSPAFALANPEGGKHVLRLLPAPPG
ncbi:MAG: tetratricopeptide repeat protein [Terracidiphilus sp.]|jgi:hypothetical protein